MASNTKSNTNSKKATYRRKATQTKKKTTTKTTSKSVAKKTTTKKAPVKKVPVNKETKKDVEVVITEQEEKPVEAINEQEIKTEPVIESMETKAPVAQETNTAKNGFSLAGLICSVCGFITCGVSSLFGIILSFIGLSKAKKNGGIGKEQAVTGVILGIVSALIYITLFSTLYVFSTKTVNETIKRANERNIPVYSMNEKINVTDSFGDYTIKVTGARETSERIDDSQIKADRVIVISYEYQNINMDQNLFITSARFAAYDNNNVVLQNYPIDYLLPDYIARGRTAKAEAVYAFNGDDNHIDLEYYKNIFDERPYCIIEVEW